MIDEKILARVFRAASNGVMEPYNAMWRNMPTGSSGGFSTTVQLPSNYLDAKAHADSMAGAFGAIADVFEKCGEAADESTKATDP